jgi:integrase
VASLIKDYRARSPYYICCYTAPDGKRIKRSTKQTNKEKAWTVCLSFVEAEEQIAKESATEQQLRRVIDSALTRIGEKKLTDRTVREHLETWLGSKRGATADTTLEAYEQAADLLIEFLGARADKSVRLLTKKDVVTLRDKLVSEGRTPNTVNKLVKKYLASAFSDAVADRVLESNPFSSVDGLKETKIQKGTFTPEQIAELLAVADRDWQGCILLGYTTGARLRDAANMRWSAVDVRNGLIKFVERKGSKETITGLHPDFAEWITSQPAPDDPDAPLFPTLAGKPAKGEYGLSNMFVKLMEKAGIVGKRLRTAKGLGRSVNSLRLLRQTCRIYSRTTSFACLSVRSPRKTGCRS